jgi:biotin carboxylase
MSVESFVIDSQICFVNLTEYLLPLWANVVPAALDAEQEQRVRTLNTQLIEHFGVVRGMVHIEMFLTHAGPVFGEIALRPPGGQVMRLIERAYAFDPWEAVLQIELGSCPELPQRAQTYAGVWFIHPGPGTVTRMQGIGVAERVPGAFEISCRARVGDVITPRGGSGESTGHVMVEGASRRAVVEGLERARRAIVVEVEPLDSERQPKPK